MSPQTHKYVLPALDSEVRSQNNQSYPPKGPTSEFHHMRNRAFTYGFRREEMQYLAHSSQEAFMCSYGTE